LGGGGTGQFHSTLEGAHTDTYSGGPLSTTFNGESGPTGNCGLRGVGEREVAKARGNGARFTLECVR